MRAASGVDNGAGALPREERIGEGSPWIECAKLTAAAAGALFYCSAVTWLISQVLPASIGNVAIPAAAIGVIYLVGNVALSYFNSVDRL